MVRMLASLMNYYTSLMHDPSHFIILSVISLLSMYLYYYFILIPVHECGHLIFGLASGYSFISFRIRTLTIVKESRILRIRRFSIYGSDGQCLMCPPPYSDAKHPFLLYMMGGVVLDCAKLFLLILAVTDTYKFSYDVRLILIIFVFVEVMNISLNGIPLKLFGLNNDAMNTCLMLNDKQAVKSWYCTAHIFNEINKGKTYKELSEVLYIIPRSASLKNDIIAWHKINQCYYFMDLKYWDKALACTLEVINSGSRAMRCLALTEKIFLSILLDKSTIEIEAFSNYKKMITNKGAYDIYQTRVQIAYELLNDSSRENRNRLISKWNKLKMKYPYKGEEIFCSGLVKEMMK